MLGGVGNAVDTYCPPPMFIPMPCGGGTAAAVCPECFKEDEEDDDDEEEVTGVTETEPVVSYRIAAAPPIMCAWLYQSARWAGLKSAAAAALWMGAAATAPCWWWW